MSLERINAAYTQLLEYLAHLQSTEILESAGFPEKFKLKKEIERCTSRLQFWSDILSNSPTLIGELPSKITFEDLLNESLGNQILLQPVKINANEESILSYYDENQLLNAHLIVAVFWKKRSSEEVQVKPELCYFCPESRSILKLPLSQEPGFLRLNEIPDSLKELADFSAQKLSDIFGESLRPWQLTIELFLPIDLLSRPLTQWCGESKRVAQIHPIVIRCSDRFDPDRSVYSVNPNDQLTPEQLHNQLKSGWQRFQNNIPDGCTNTLHCLAWLDLATTTSVNLEGYSGLKCHGTWLTSNEEHITHWEELVISGIPLALWLTDGQPNHPMIATTYDYLTNCNRFEFLEKVREVLSGQIQSQSCNYRVGVFYEDPNYVPTVPRPSDKQFFSWPGSQ